MQDFLYMLGVVAVGFALNFGLRALPFMLFGGRKGALPPWVERLGNVVSPVIIAGLIVYSYSGLQWKSAWPYLAGALTVGLQIWKRNPLASIVAGTALYMCLVGCGCSSTRAVRLDSDHPSVRVATDGIWFGSEKVPPAAVPAILADNDIPKTRVVHIKLDGDVKDLREARFLMGLLGKAGYTRPVLVTERHGESYATGKKAKTAGAAVGGIAPNGSAPKKIRYKRAAE